MYQYSSSPKGLGSFRQVSPGSIVFYKSVKTISITYQNL